MNVHTIISRISALQHIDNSVIESLYALSTRSALVNLLLAILTTIALFPILQLKIIIWFVILGSLILFRMYNTHLYYKEEDPDMEKWYKRFTLHAYATAVLYSSLGFLLIHFVPSDASYYQLFILTIMLGLSAGSSFALFQDIRLSTIYMSILLLPLILTLPFINTLPINSILSVALFMYYFAQVTIIYKIYEQKRTIDTLESNQTLLHSLFKNAPLGIFTYSKDLKILDCNEALSDLFDHGDVNKVIGMDLHALSDTRGLPALKRTLGDGPQFYEGPYVSLKGTKYWVEAKAFSFVDGQNNALGGVAIIEDKTKEHKAVQELEYLVEHDTLTGLLNRRGINNYIDKLIDNPLHKTHYSVLFYLDLDQFKSINDSLGHAVGDEVLLAVSQRLISSLIHECVVSRLSGDEFIVLSPLVSDDKDMAEAETAKCAKRMQAIFHEPYLIQDMHLHIKSSIGAVVIEPGYKNAEEVIRHADLAMYQAKHSNENIAYYDESLDQKQKDLFLLQQDLAYATYHDQLDLFLQPIVSIKDESIFSAELLIRWTHPDRGLLSPDAFIPLAAKAGFLSEITWWIVDKTCEQISIWKREGKWKLDYISININATQFLETNFAKAFLDKLKYYDVKTSEIMLEITERSLIDHFTATQGVINDLRSYGIKCAIDDFGTGYSSLSYLKRLSFHTLKIDREFVKDIGQKPKELALMNTILDIGRQFDYHIIVEGIENERQKSLLLELDEGLSYQGYYFSKPLHADEFEKKFLNAQISEKVEVDVPTFE